MDRVTQELLDFDRAMEEAAQAETNHKAAFRIGYDLLKAYWPPRQDEEYWKRVADEITLQYAQHRDNPLIVPMLVMILDYLDEAGRKAAA